MDELRQAKEISDWLDGQLHDLDIPNTRRARLAAASLHMASEHAGSVLVLTEHYRYGSAAALVRPAFESYVRGIWLHRCSTETELERFERSDRINKNFDTLIEEIERHEDFGECVLSEIKDLSWSTMNSMTHGGMRQLSRRMTATEITSHYNQEDIDRAVSTAAATSLLAAIAVANMTGDIDVARAILKRSEAYVDIS